MEWVCVRERPKKLVNAGFQDGSYHLCRQQMDWSSIYRRNQTAKTRQAITQTIHNHYAYKTFFAVALSLSVYNKPSQMFRLHNANVSLNEGQGQSQWSHKSVTSWKEIGSSISKHTNISGYFPYHKTHWSDIVSPLNYKLYNQVIKKNWN